MPTEASDSRRPAGLALAAFAGLATLTAYLGARTATRGKQSFYERLRKPRGTPSDAIIGLVWTGLFGLSAISGYRVWKQPPSAQRSRALALWGTQLALNANWSRLFFGKRKARAAFADLVALWATLGAYILQSRNVDRTAARMMAPYLGWVTYAGYLNEELIRKNRRLLN